MDHFRLKHYQSSPFLGKQVSETIESLPPEAKDQPPSCIGVTLSWHTLFIDLDRLLDRYLPYLINHNRRTSSSMSNTLRYMAEHDIVIAQIAMPNKHMMSFSRSP